MVISKSLCSFGPQTHVYLSIQCSTPLQRLKSVHKVNKTFHLQQASHKQLSTNMRHHAPLETGQQHTGWQLSKASAKQSFSARLIDTRGAVQFRYMTSKHTTASICLSMALVGSSCLTMSTWPSLIHIVLHLKDST